MKKLHLPSLNAASKMLVKLTNIAKGFNLLLFTLRKKKQVWNRFFSACFLETHICRSCTVWNRFSLVLDGTAKQPQVITLRFWIPWRFFFKDKIRFSSVACPSDLTRIKIIWKRRKFVCAWHQTLWKLLSSSTQTAGKMLWTKSDIFYLYFVWVSDKQNLAKHSQCQSTLLNIWK